MSGGWVSQNVAQSPYVPMAQKSVDPVIKCALKYVVNFFIAYWIYKNSLKLVFRVHCATDSDVIPFCTLTDLTVDCHFVNAGDYFWLTDFWIVVYNTLYDWLIDWFTPRFLWLPAAQGNDWAWFLRDFRVWFVWFVWLRCLTGVAREYCCGPSYDFTWLLVI
jgi:hypothetical protein